MIIDVLCSSKNHPVWPLLEGWQQRHADENKVRLIRSVKDTAAGEILFLISCTEIVSASIRDQYKKVLVIHASDLPDGKGWSPHIWQIVEGRTELTLTLFEAVDAVDAGPIWHKIKITIEPHELYDEINSKVFDAEILLMDYAVDHFVSVRPQSQPPVSEASCYYRKRGPEDSRIDPNTSIASQFNLIRVSDPLRFPAFIELHGYRYTLTLKKAGKTKSSEA